MRTSRLSLLAILLVPAPLFAQDSTMQHEGMSHDAHAGMTHSDSSHDAHALKWGPAPSAFPAGARMAVVSGDPSKSGPFAVRLAMPNGYKVSPHFHPTDETVSVKRGTLLVGMGDTFDAAKTKSMAAGAHATMKAGAHHFATAKGKTLIEIAGTGPMAITYVDPKDDPRGASQP